MAEGQGVSSPVFGATQRAVAFKFDSSIGSEAGGSGSGEPGWPSGTEGMSFVPPWMTSPERAEGAGTAGMSGH